MWAPQRLTTLWTSTACYNDSFNLPLYIYLLTTSIYIGNTDIYIYISMKFSPNLYLLLLLLLLVGWDLRHQVLRQLLAYCTAPDDR
jgi:hypothetical protein